MIIEEEGAIDKLQNKCIKGLNTLFKYRIHYHKLSLLNLFPPFTNKEGAK